MPFGRTLGTLLCAATVVAGAPAAYAAEPERNPAQVHGLTAAPDAVDAATGDAPVAVSVRVADADGVAAVTLRLAAGAPAPLHLTAGHGTDGTWSGVASVPAYTGYGPIAATVDVADETGAPTSAVVDGVVSVRDAAPAAPTEVTVAASPDALRVEWAPPAANGGSAVESYDVTAVPAATGAPATTVSAAADEYAATLPGLSSDTRYVVRVAARNAVGAGATAEARTIGVVARPEDRALRVEWTRPPTEVSRYDVRATPRTDGVAVPPVVTAGSAASATLVTGLVNGETYDVTVTAVAADGAGPWTAVGTPRTVPGAPVLGTVTAGAGSAVVRWSPPASDGGAPVESYVVTASTGPSVSVPATARSATVPDLPNGVATSFAVVAVNAAGAGPAAGGGPVTPRQPGRLVLGKAPVTSVVHGTATVVGARVVAAGLGVPGQRVDLLARRAYTTTWRRVASATTDGAGAVTLRATLPTSSALRLRHPVGAVSAPDLALPTVQVATRVTADVNASRIRLGQTVVVRGGIAPAHPVGSPVLLQRYVSGAWRTVATGRMTSTTAYAVSWKPTGPGAWSVRVVKPADRDHATGYRAPWRQQVDREVVVDIARAILHNGRITLAAVHVTPVRDLATARQNVVDVANGRPARRSSYQNAPGGSTPLDPRLLGAVRRLGALGSVTVSEIAGGSHAPGSDHYVGRGLDVTWWNGRHVGRGSGYGSVLEVCRAYGASKIFHPSYDPYGGHQGHVHCAWS